jgi:hypothetical protein
MIFKHVYIIIYIFLYIFIIFPIYQIEHIQPLLLKGIGIHHSGFLFIIIALLLYIIIFYFFSILFFNLFSIQYFYYI